MQIFFFRYFNLNFLYTIFLKKSENIHFILFFERIFYHSGQLVINDLRAKVFKSILCQDMGFFNKNKVGEIVSRLSTDAFIVGNSVSMNLTEGARALVTCAGSAALLVLLTDSLWLSRFQNIFLYEELMQL